MRTFLAAVAGYLIAGLVLVAFLVLLAAFCHLALLRRLNGGRRSLLARMRGCSRCWRYYLTGRWPRYEGGRHPDITIGTAERDRFDVLAQGYRQAGTVAPEPRYERRPR